MCSCMMRPGLFSPPPAPRMRPAAWRCEAAGGQAAPAGGGRALGAASGRPRSPARLLLEGATVVDTRDGSLSPATDIFLQDGRIAGVAPSGGAPHAADLIRIDARGRYVIPGFLDMHAHTLQMADPTGSLELMLAWGVTGFRQLAGSSALLKQRRDGALPLPVDSPEVLEIAGAVLTPANAATPAMAVATVRGQKDEGADFIKAALVTPEVFFAAQAEAHRLGLPILGHLPTGIDAVEASRGGMKSIEHLGPGVGILASCSSDEAALRAAMAGRPLLRGPPFRIPFADQLMAPVIRRLVLNPLTVTGKADVEILAHAIDTFDEGKCLALAERFVADGTWQCPTLIRLRTQELADDADLQSDPGLAYVAATTLRAWKTVTETFSKLPAASRATFRKAYDLQLKLTGLFDRAGVGMIAGSDVSGAAWQVPGITLHDEFDELARAGMTPLKVLQMTTLHAAAFLGRSAEMGTVEVGKLADLVLLDANPMESVGNLHAVGGVVRAGSSYSRDDLEALKRGVASARSVH